MNLKKLRERKDYLTDELCDLHHHNLFPHIYKEARLRLEYKIVTLEEAIEFEEKMLPFKKTLVIFIAIAILSVTCLMIFNIN